MTQKILMFAITSTIISSLGWAQNQSSDELDLGLDPVYTEKLDGEASDAVELNTQRAAPKQVQVGNQQSLEQGGSFTEPRHPNLKRGERAAAQPIYILNQSNPTATNQAQLQTQAQASAAQIQKQPTTFIEATPVSDSAAERLRKARQDSEVQTEQKIVEKLESSRLEDEKKRADVLFGDRFNQMNQQNQSNQYQSTPQLQQQVQPPPPPVQVAPAVQTPPPPAVVIIPEDTLIDEPRHTYKSKESTVDSVEEDSKTYVIGLLGVSEFNNANNVQGVMATGLGLGVEYKHHLLTEIDFIYTQFQRNYPIVTNIDQYTVMGQVKYQILRGLVRPIVGGALSYSYRSFDDAYQYSNNPYYYTNGQNSYKTTSNTLDAGLTLGVDVAASDTFSVGIDYRYMWNLTHKSNGFYPVFFSDQTSIDSLNYYVLSVNGRFVF